jgi:hypothetical protein
MPVMPLASCTGREKNWNKIARSENTQSADSYILTAQLLKKRVYEEGENKEEREKREKKEKREQQRQTKTQCSVSE